MKKLYKNKSFGLVLTGGGLKGAYQVGAWRALKELKVKITAIVGTSIGALNGALILQDDIELLERLYNEIELEKIMNIGKEIDKKKSIKTFDNLIKIASEYILQKGLSNEPLENLVDKYLDTEKIYDSKIDFGMVTFGLNDMKAKEVFKSDIPKEKMKDYLLATSCFPIFRPYEIEKEKYIDGGVYDNMPINMLIKKGFKDIIVIDINGVGITHKNVNKNVYIKMVYPNEGLGDTFNFDKNIIDKNIKLGYLDTMKAFNKLCGNNYYFSTKDYSKMLNLFSLETINGLENAAEIYEIDRYKQYNYIKFLNLIYNKYLKDKETSNMIKEVLSFNDIVQNIKGINSMIDKGIGINFFVNLIKTEPTVVTKKRLLGAFSNYIEAAKAIIELENYKNNSIL